MNLFCFGIGYSALALHTIGGGAVTTFSGTVRTAEKAALLRQRGIEAHVLAKGEPSNELAVALRRADAILVSAAPGDAGDPMLAALAENLQACAHLRLVIYLSTVGVYGDHQGALIDEGAPLRATSERGVRRIAAEQAWQAFGKERGIAIQIHRLAGIYGPGRSVVDDLRAGTARRIIKEGQVFNRIHVDDIAGAALAGLHKPEIQGAFNVCDDEPCPPQDVVLHAATVMGLPPPPETPFERAELSEMGRSFYAESKRCRNDRLKSVLGYSLRYPTYREGIAALITAG